MRYTLDEAATQLRKTPRWLNDWVRAHPVDDEGRAFYTPAGRDKVFLPSDITRIEAALRGELQCRSISGRRAGGARRISKSADHTSDAAWKKAAELLNDPSLESSSSASRTASSSTASGQRPALHLVQRGSQQC